MPRAKTKAELIHSANENFQKMWKMIDMLSEQQQRQNFTYDPSSQDDAFHWKRDKNLRDVLMHLYEWHQLLLNWVHHNMQGETRSFLPEGITWKNYQIMNEGFFEKNQAVEYETAKQLLQQSHEQVLALMEQFSDDELFEKKYFNWTGTTNLGSYYISVTASHYDWAMKKIKVYLKALQ